MDLTFVLSDLMKGKENTVSWLDDILTQTKNREELLGCGYIRECISKLTDKRIFAKELIKMIIEYLDCVVDLNFDQTKPGNDKFNWFNSKKVQKRMIKESETTMIIMDKIFTNRLCKTFKILFKIDWSAEFGSYCRIGYVTRDIDQSIPDFSAFLGGTKANRYKYQYGIELNAGKQLFTHNVNKQGDTRGKFTVPHKSGDIWTLFYSFENHYCSISHNENYIGICFEHKGDPPTAIIPAISLHSFDGEDYGTVQILHCVLNCNEL